MAHVDWQAGERSERRHQAEQQAQRDIRGKPAEMIFQECGNALRALLAEHRLDAPVVGDAVLEAAQHEPVVGIAGEQARRPQQHPGKSRIHDSRPEQ